MKRDNLQLLVLVRLLTSLYFYSPYMTLYFRARGFSFLQINSMWGIIVLTMFLAEIPTGLLADRWGRRRAIQAAIFLQFIGEVLFLFIQDYWLLVIDAVIAGLGFAFGSGALEALVYDHLLTRGKESQMAEAIGRIESAGYIGFILSFSLSGLLVPQADAPDIRTAILLTAISVGIGFLITLMLKSEPRITNPQDVQAKSSFLLKDGITLLYQNRLLRTLVLFSILTIPFWDYFGSLYQPYFQAIEVPGYLFGPTLALANLAAFIISRNIARITRFLGARWSILAAILIPGLIYLFLVVNRLPLLGIFSVILFRGSTAIRNPLFSKFFNQHIASQNRATVLSMISMLASGYTAVMGLILGATADRWFYGAFILSGVLISIASGVFALRIKELAGIPQNKSNCS
jgi:predicted MFS family arabinose efflux permease